MTYASEVRELKATLETLPNIPRSIIRDSHISFLNVECLRLMGEMIAEQRLIITAAANVEQSSYHPDTVNDALETVVSTQFSTYLLEKELYTTKATSQMINTDEFLSFYEKYETARIETAIEAFIAENPDLAKEVIDVKAKYL